MSNQTRFQSLLEELLGSDEVHFQPPANLTMEYPAITYEVDDIPPQYADNGIFLRTTTYTVTGIDYDPDSPVFQKLADFPRSRFDTRFSTEQLNHSVFTINF